MINTVLFDLDGTLLSMDTDLFIKQYFGLISIALKDYLTQEEVVKLFWEATSKVISSNDETTTNEEVFFQHFFSKVDLEEQEVVDVLYDFYENEFSKLKALAESKEEMIESIKILKDKGYDVVVATNPIFPEVAIHQRIEWADLNKDDFIHITHLEEAHFTKPNVNYYKEILEKIKKEPSECLMVGNHLEEDMISREIGLETYLITNHLMGDESDKSNVVHEGNYQDFLAFIKELPTL